MKKFVAVFAALIASASQANEWHQGTLLLSYDVLGRIEQVQRPGGGTTTYSYNFADQQKSLDYDGMGVISGTEFGPTGRLQRRIFVGDLETPQGIEERTYDVLGRLHSQRLQLDGEDSYSASQLTYDPRSYLVSVDRDDPLLEDTVISYEYTEQGQLATFGLAGTQGTSQASFSYDSQGNLLARSGLFQGELSLPPYSASSPYDSANRPTAPGWEYDVAGRLTRDPDHFYEYDSAGRLALVTDSAGDLVAHYLYDSSGHRVRKMTDTEVIYTYRDAGGRVVSEHSYDLNGTLLSKKDFVNQDGDTVLIAEREAEESRTRQLSDRLGSPVVRWNEDQISYQEYSPFGWQMGGAEERREGPHGFTGHDEDAETGAIYMQARYYDPESARFSRPDPARDVSPMLPASYNLYSYTANNPVNFLDPTGEAGDPEESSVGVGLEKIGAGALLFLGGATLVVFTAPVTVTGGLLVAGISTAFFTMGGLEVAEGSVDLLDAAGHSGAQAIPADQRNAGGEAAAEIGERLGQDGDVWRRGYQYAETAAHVANAGRAVSHAVTHKLSSGEKLVVALEVGVAGSSIDHSVDLYNSDHSSETPASSGSTVQAATESTPVKAPRCCSSSWARDRLRKLIDR